MMSNEHGDAMLHSALRHYSSAASASCPKLFISRHQRLIFGRWTSLWLAEWPGTRYLTLFVIQDVRLTVSGMI